MCYRGRLPRILQHICTLQKRKRKKNCDDEEDDDDSEYSPNSDTQDEDEDTSDYSAQRTLPLRRPRKPAVSITAYSRGNALA